MGAVLKRGGSLFLLTIMPKVIKIVISGEFYENELSADPTKISAEANFADGMTRMVLGKHLKDTDEVTISTEDSTDDKTKHMLKQAIFGSVTISILKEHANKKETN